MEEDQSAIPVAEGAIKSIKLSLSTEDEIRTYSINDCPVTHPSQLGNPFLGLPLETGKCESCGASENGKCEGHFGYIELPVPIYHPCHVTELRQILNLVCLKCLRVKKGKVKQAEGKDNTSALSCYYCRDLPALSLKEIKTADGAFRLELKMPPRKFMTEGSWNFLDKYGFHHGGTSHCRTLLPEEALNILKKIPDETKRKLAARGYIAQSGYVMKYLPVPPNCLYIPEFTDGQSIMSYDISISLLKKVLQKIEQIKKSRAGSPNFESHEVESSDLQLPIAQYIHLRGTTRTSFSDLVYSTLSVRGPGEALQFLNVLQPLLMELILLDGFSVSLQDFNVPKVLLEEAQKNIEKQSLILEQSRCAENQFVEMRVDNNLKDIKQQISDFVVKRSHLGLLIDPKSDSSVSKVVQQLGFVGLQLYREGKFYSRRLVEDCYYTFVNKHPAVREEHSPEAYGLVQSSYFHGLNPYEELVHAISTREAIVRSSRGLTEPGTLFKNLMALLRDVVICYDGTEILQTTSRYKNDMKDRKVILFLNDCSCAKKFCKEKAAIAVQGCLRRITLEDCATDICIEYQKQIGLDGTSEAAPALVGHIHLDRAHLERINISTEDILQKCQEVSGKYGKKKGHLSDPRIQEAKIVWVGSDSTSWVKNTQKASKGEPAVEIIVEEEEALHIGDAWRTTMDACIPVLNLIDIRRSIPYGIQQVRELLGISCAFDQVVQRLSTTVRMVAKDVLKDHLVLVANSMTFTGNLNGFNNAGYKATFRSLKVQVPFTESTLITPMKCFEKAAEKCHSDSLGCVVSSCSWGKHAASGTGSSFQILWNESQLKSNKEYGDGLYDYLALVRTDEEKARYTFFDDVDYLAEENEADVCLSPELDGTIGQPIFDDNLEEQDVQKNSSWDNGTTTNASWEQNGSAGNDSDKWGGWNDAAAGADTVVTKPADQGNSCWDVPATVEKSSSDWGGWGTEKAKEKENISEEPAEHDAWSVQGPKRATDGGASWKKQSSTQNDGNSWKENKGRGSNGGSWEKDNAQKGSWGSDEAENNNDLQNKSWETVAANAHASTEKSWGNVTASPLDNAWSAAPSAGVDASINKDKESWGNVPASPSDSAWNAAPVSQEDDGWNSAQANESRSKDWKSDGWGARGGNWRGQRNNPGRPPRKPDGRGLPRRPDERGPPRRHFDLTAEEEKILGEIEPTSCANRFREAMPLNLVILLFCKAQSSLWCCSILDAVTGF
uniref:DNA-directed RNA polymerase n=1 Tax=Oryza punctata TaxID=4537 RepID=A0A0E0JVN1_ORYPU